MEINEHDVETAAEASWKWLRYRFEPRQWQDAAPSRKAYARFIAWASLAAVSRHQKTEAGRSSLLAGGICAGAAADDSTLSRPGSACMFAEGHWRPRLRSWSCAGEDNPKEGRRKAVRHFWGGPGTKLAPGLENERRPRLPQGPGSSGGTRSVEIVVPVVVIDIPIWLAIVVGGCRTKARAASPAPWRGESRQARQKSCCPAALPATPLSSAAVRWWS
jgi:hypothetical protein